MRRTLIVSAVVSALVLAGGVAYASIPGPDGVIHGCYKNTDGSARIIDSAASCPNGYTAVNWTQAPLPVTVTRVVRHTYVSQVGIYIPETVTCPAGKRAINGGVIQAQAVGWPEGATNTGNHPSVREDPGYEMASPTDPTLTLSLPRPVDNGTGWRLLTVNYHPIVGGLYLDLDVTLFAVCI